MINRAHIHTNSTKLIVTIQYKTGEVHRVKCVRVTLWPSTIAWKSEMLLRDNTLYRIPADTHTMFIKLPSSVHSALIKFAVMVRWFMSVLARTALLPEIVREIAHLACEWYRTRECAAYCVGSA